MQLRKASSPPKADQVARGDLRQMASSTELGVFEASSSPLLRVDELAGSIKWRYPTTRTMSPTTWDT